MVAKSAHVIYSEHGIMKDVIKMMEPVFASVWLREKIVINAYHNIMAFRKILKDASLAIVHMVVLSIMTVTSFLVNANAAPISKEDVVKSLKTRTTAPILTDLHLKLKRRKEIMPKLKLVKDPFKLAHGLAKVSLGSKKVQISPSSLTTFPSLASLILSYVMSLMELKAGKTFK